MTPEVMRSEAIASIHEHLQLVCSFPGENVDAIIAIALQEMRILAGHILCDLLEQAVAK